MTGVQTCSLPIYGGDGIDTISGGRGNGYIEGGNGDDVIVATGGKNVLSGGLGYDNITASGNGDRVYTGGGTNTVGNLGAEGLAYTAGVGDKLTGTGNEAPTVVNVVLNRSEERSVGDESGSTFRTRWYPYRQKKTKWTLKLAL